MSRERDTVGPGAQRAEDASGEDLLVVGRLGAPYGVRGWLKVHSSTEPPENIFSYAPWLIRVGDDWVELDIDDARSHGKALVVHPVGYDDRDAVRPLVGAEIRVGRESFEPLQAGEYYWADLIGAQVETRAGQVLGRVDHLIETGANDVLVVAGERERLIPFVMARYILSVDLAGKRIVVDWDPED